MLANPHKYVSLNIIFSTLFVFYVEIATSPLSAEREAFEELLILLDIFRQTACDHSYHKIVKGMRILWAVILPHKKYFLE